MFRQADIGIGAISVDVDREKVIDFTVPFYDMVGLKILIRKVKQSTDIWKFINVLKPEVWYCVLGTYFLSSLLLWLINRYNAKTRASQFKLI